MNNYITNNFIKRKRGRPRKNKELNKELSQELSQEPSQELSQETNQSTNQECQICINSYSLSNFIKCNYCNNLICINCAKRWLLKQTMAYTCPFCKKGWDWNFIFSNFSKDFINKDLKQ